MDKIEELETVIRCDYSNITGIVIQKNGERRYERYFNGYTAENALHVYSVTKSVFSLLMGIAFDKGRIKSVDQRVLDFFPEYSVRAGEKTIRQVTIRNLLTMTAPYRCRTEPFEEFFASGDWVKTALDFLGGEERPGEFLYSPIIGAHILSGILTRATGQTGLDFAVEHLFSPLGIGVTKPVILGDKETHIAVMNDKGTRGWAVDPQGLITASFGLFLTPVEMAKLGQLCLNGGMWEGERLVSARWIAESTREHSRWGALPYGYLWWIMDERAHSYAAMGDGGNVIYVNGEKDLVISITSLFASDVKDRIELIQTCLEPMIEEGVL